jgi:uncharacterized protein
VVVHGGFYTLDPRGSAWERAEAETAMHLTSELLPDTSTDPDSVAEPVVLFRIAVQEVSGRAAEPASGLAAV